MSTAQLILAALEPYKLKEEHPGHWRCNSPLRPGSNSHAFTLTIDDGEHGAYIDHVSGDSGSLYDLAAKLKIPLPRTSTIETTKRLYAGIEDYARAHGVTAACFDHAGWHETVQDSRPALAISTSTGTRWRFLDNQKPVYKSPHNYNRCWYGLRRAAGMAQQLQFALIICNGEASTVVGQEFGLPVCAVTAGEHPSIPEHLLAELKKLYPSGPIIVAFDCDQAGRKKAPALAEQLCTAGYEARAIDLGLDVSGDIADLCKLYGPDALNAVRKCPTLEAKASDAQTYKTWRIISLEELKHLPEATWLIDSLIPEQGLSALYGGSGEGKSFYALSLAMKVARTSSVIYIAAEGELGFRKRAASWCQHHQVSESDLKIAFCMGTVSLLDEQDKTDFIEALQQHKPALVVVDTVAMTMVGGDENSARDMGMYLRACREIMQAHNCAVMLVHHTGKDRLAERGSSALRATCDVMVRLTAEDDVIRIECSKTKDEAAFDPFYIRLLPVLESVVAIPAEKIKALASDPLSQRQRAVLDILAMDIHAEGATAPEIEQLGSSTHGATVHAVNRLIQHGFVERADRGVFVITEKGRQMIDRDQSSIDRGGLNHTQPDSEGTEGTIDRVDRVDRVDRRGGRSTPENLYESRDQRDQSQTDPTMAEEFDHDQRDQSRDQSTIDRDQSFLSQPDSYYRKGG